MDILSAASRAGGGALVLELVFLVVAIVAAVKVLPKAGYSAWFALLLLIPLVGFVMILVFAFADWPVDKELRHYRLVLELVFLVVAIVAAVKILPKAGYSAWFALLLLIPLVGFNSRRAN